MSVPGLLATSPSDNVVGEYSAFGAPIRETVVKWQWSMETQACVFHNIIDLTSQI